MSGCKDYSLKGHCEADEQLAFSELRSNQSCARQWNRSKETLFPEAGLRRLRDRRKRRDIIGEHVGIQQHVRRCPPAELSLRKEVQNDFVGEERRDEQVSSCRFSENCF